MKALTRTLMRLVVIAMVVVGSQVPAQGGGKDVSLELSGGHDNRNMTACDKEPKAEYYKVGDKVKFAGDISPAPQRTHKVEVIVKRCMGGDWVKVMGMKVQVQSNGTFSGSFSVGETSKCFVKAIFSGDASGRKYFRVVN